MTWIKSQKEIKTIDKVKGIEKKTDKNKGKGRKTEIGIIIKTDKERDSEILAQDQGLKKEKINIEKKINMTDTQKIEKK